MSWEIRSKPTVVQLIILAGWERISQLMDCDNPQMPRHVKIYVWNTWKYVEAYGTHGIS